MKFYEIDVALTDLFLFVACTIYAFSILRIASHCWVNRILWLSVFVSAGLASFFGAWAHGIYGPQLSYNANPTYQALWVLIFLFMGVAGYATLRLALRYGHWSRIEKAVALLLLPYFAYAIFFGVNFLYCALFTLLGQSVFLFVSARGLWRQEKVWKEAFLGCLLTWMALLVQIFQITPFPENLSHNALFHLIQLAGLHYYFRFARQDL